MKTEPDRSRLLPLLVCGVLALTGGYAPQPSAAEEAVEEATEEAAAGDVSAESEEEETEEAIQPTHQELGAILVETEAEAGSLRTFCLNADGNLLVARGGDRVVFARGENGMMEVKKIVEPAEIRVIDPEGKRIATWSLEVTPQAINVAEDGTVFVGGEGRLAKLDKSGNVLKTADAPNVAELGPLPEAPGDQLEEEKQLSEEEQKAKQDKIAALSDRLSTVRDTLLEAVRERAAAKDDEKALAAANEKFNTAYNEYIAGQSELRELTVDPHVLAMQQWAAALRQRAVTGIAVTGSDVFVACPAVKGYGYDVWRTDLEFGGAKRIVTGLRGCCGQMDIQARDGELFVAENARGQVVRYDRDGNQLAAWGKKDRSDPKCFGSCCNPMNIRFGPGGEVYTSEASVGCVKRFTADGEFVGLVGSVELIPGCKHVAIGVSNDGGRVYVLDITRSHIAVLGAAEE